MPQQPVTRGRIALAVMAPVLALAAVLVPGLAAQTLVDTGVTPGSLDSLPALPFLAPTSPRDTLLFADRFEITPDTTDMPALATTPVLVDATVPASETGTGFVEFIQYQLPTTYVAGTPLPMVVVYHGFGASDGSVSSQSAIDEWCEAYGWIYLSPTGLDDKLFGSVPSQQNTAAAIRWMTNNFDVDADRIYMIGHSMGGGVVTNFAARHRDPDDIMIAAVGTVSGSFDWTSTWNYDPSVQPWLEHPLNFDGSPAAEPFAYQRCSSLYHDPASYPPYPGSLDSSLSMSTNLSLLPVYITWDSGDTLPQLPAQSVNLGALLGALGATVTTREVSGTVDGGGAPATHSWAVLDELELFEFFDGVSVDRYPASFDAQVGDSGPLAWLDVTLADVEAFTWFSAEVDAGVPRVELTDVSGAAALQVHTGLVGLSAPVTVLGASADSTGFQLGLSGGVGMAEDQSTADLAAGSEYEDPGETTSVPVPGLGSISVAGQAASWNVGFSASADPVGIGQALTLTLQHRTSQTLGLLLAGLTDQYVPLSGGEILVLSLDPPAQFISLPLDPVGTTSLVTTIPSDAALSGARILIQVVVLKPTGGVDSASEPIALDIE